MCVFLLVLGGLFSTQRALQHSGCQETIRGWPHNPHTRSRILTLLHQRSHHVSAHLRTCTHIHGHIKPHTSCTFIVYKTEWILIVLNRAFTTQMLFRGLRVHPHAVSPMMHTQKQYKHTHRNAQTNSNTLKQTFLTCL